MKLTLNRIHKGNTYTIGKLYIDGVYFCDTLEDRVRNFPKEIKVMGKTAIPAGTYKVVVTMSPRFKRMLPLLENVPYFSGIRIHRGNTEADSSGCILVGKNNQKGRLSESAKYEQELTRRLRGSVHTITIR